jgi:hypothetical protein
MSAAGGVALRMQFPVPAAWVDYVRERDPETALFRCSQRDSAVMCISSLFFFRDPRSDATRKATSPPQALRGELHTLDRRPNLPSPR